MGQVGRREFLVAAGVLLAEPLMASAQSTGKRIFRVGGLSNSTPEAASAYIKALEEGFGELGYGVGKDLLIEYLYAAGQPDRLPGLAAELVRRKPDAIVTVSNAETSAAMGATSSIPIVMGLGAGPVHAGLIASLGNPGGNVTGLTTDASPQILGKQLELLGEVLPNLKRVGVLWDSTVPGFGEILDRLEEGARSMAVTLRFFEARRAEELEPALAQISTDRLDALCVVANVLTFTFRMRIAEFTIERGLPAISYMNEFVHAGLLMSYGADLLQLYKRAAVYVDKIFKGAKPANLPVEQPTRFEMAINLHTAKRLGLTFPSSILLRADRVFE